MYLPELSLIKTLLNKECYNKYYTVLDIKSIKTTYPELGWLYETLEKLHAAKETSPTLDELKLFFYTTYPDVDKFAYETLFTRLESDEVDSSLAETLLKDMLLRKESLTLSELAYKVSQGSANYEEIGDWFSKQSDTPRTLDVLDRVSDDLEDILCSVYKERGLRWRLSCLNKSLGSLRDGDFGFIFARPECISGDSKIRVKYHKSSSSSRIYIIAQFYKLFNGNHHLRCSGHQIQSTTPDGKVYYNDIEHVTYSGKKEVWQVATKRGFTLKTTLDHEFLLPNGSYAQLKDLSVGSEVRSDRTEKAKRRTRSELSGKWPGSPYPEKMVGVYGPYHRAKTHRLAYDAGLNYMDIPAFVKMLSDGEAKNLVFSDQSLDIHHLDMDHENNKFNNLKLITREEHTAHHASRCEVGNSHYADVDIIVSIDYVGLEDVYDIGVSGENKNFRADGIYIHNCGKTTFLADSGANFLAQAERPVIWFNNEEDGKKVMIRVYQAFFGITLDQLMSNAARYKQMFKAKTNGLLQMYDAATIGRRDVERIVAREKPSLVIYDQLIKIKGFTNDRKDLQLGETFQWARELAKNNHAAIGVAQADGSAEGVKWLTMDHVANVKTAIQAEADWILGIGKVHDEALKRVRYINISKNKLFGDDDSDPNLRHGKLEVLISPEIARYEDVIGY